MALEQALASIRGDPRSGHNLVEWREMPAVPHRRRDFGFSLALMREAIALREVLATGKERRLCGGVGMMTWICAWPVSSGESGSMMARGRGLIPGLSGFSILTVSTSPAPRRY